MLDWWSRQLATPGDYRVHVAATPSGPMFIEGNHNWGVQLAQVGSGGLLTDEFVTLLEGETGLKLDPDRQLKRRPLAAYRTRRDRLRMSASSNKA